MCKCKLGLTCGISSCGSHGHLDVIQASLNYTAAGLAANKLLCALLNGYYSVILSQYLLGCKLWTSQCERTQTKWFHQNPLTALRASLINEQPVLFVNWSLLRKTTADYKASSFRFQFLCCVSLAYISVMVAQHVCCRLWPPLREIANENKSTLIRLLNHDFGWNSADSGPGQLSRNLWTYKLLFQRRMKRSHSKNIFYRSSSV